VEPDRLRAWQLVNPWLHRIWQRMLRPENLPLSLALSLALLAVAQLGWVAGHFIDPVPISDLTESNPLLDALRDEGDRVRVSVDTSDPVLQSLLQNQFAAMDISCLDVSAASRIPDDFNTYRQTLATNQARMYFLAGVKNLAMPQSEMAAVGENPALSTNIAQAGGYTLAPTGSPNLPSHALVEMKDYLAKATLVPRAEFFATDEALLKRLQDPAWNPRDSILLSGAGKSTDATASASDDKIDLKTYTPTEMEVKAHSTTGGYVLINDQFDPDWQVRVNGHDAESLRADYIMRAVKIAPGDSTITMRYVAHYRAGGANLNACAMSLFSDGAMLLAFLIAALALRKKGSVPST
jgi:hypothetical protein